MGWVRNIVLVLCFCLAGGGAARAQMSQDLGPQAPGDFSFYVLALSWVPAYCADTPHASPQECSGSAQGFALHGLWPQGDNGYPSSCAATALPADAVQNYAGLFANPAMISHEWAKHGTCTGLDPTAYFELIKTIRAAVTIPDVYNQAQPVDPGDGASVVQAFQAANPGWPPGAVVITYRQDGKINDLEICFSKAGVAQACPQ